MFSMEDLNLRCDLFIDVVIRPGPQLSAEVSKTSAVEIDRTHDILHDFKQGVVK